MDRDNDATGFVPHKGMKVIGSDGEQIGTVDLVEDAYFIVQHGLFAQDHYIPHASIASHDEEAVYLDIPGDEALERGLGNPMVAYPGVEGDDGPDTTTGRTELATETGMDVGAGTGTEPVAREEPVNDRPQKEPRPIEDEEVVPVAETDVTERRDEDEHGTIELYEEELSATTRPVERGVVRVEKKIVEEQQTLEVPVVEEEVEVTRRRVDREIREGDHPFEERTIEIPLHGEAIEIQKHAKVVEEIDIDKTTRERMEQVTETARKERAVIDGEDVVEVEPGDTDVERTDEERA